MSGSVEIDTSHLDAAMKQLAGGLTREGDRAARTAAEDTAADIRGDVPRRTGRLAATVGVVRSGPGWAVTYGGGLPYADYIERRSHAVASGVAAALVTYPRDMEQVARREAGKL